MNEENDPNPKHYTDLSPQPIEVIEAWGLGYHLGNVVKYIARSPRKGEELEDLRKARWYLQRWIELNDRISDRHKHRPWRVEMPIQPGWEGTENGKR